MSEKSYATLSSLSPAEYQQDSYLKLSTPTAVFDTNDESSPSNVVSVFFDHVLNQLFVVRSHGATGVSTYLAPMANAPPNSRSLKYPQFKISSQFFGPIRSIKQSFEESCLTIKRANQPSQIEFLLLKDNDLFEYAFSQSCKAKNSKLQDFYWIGSTQLLIITNVSLEYYSVNLAKKNLKLMKNISMNVSWHMFHLMHSVPSKDKTVSESQGLLIVSTTDQHNVINPFIFRSGTSSGSVVKLPKFEVDMPMSSKRPGQKQQLLDSDVSVLSIYEETFVSVIRRQPGIAHSTKFSSELVLYRISKEAPAKKNYILKLSTEAGLFAVNIVDNLVVVHYQEMQTSLLFDIKLPGESDGFTTSLTPLLNPAGSIAKAAPVVHPNSGKSFEVKLYDRSWVVFSPDVIINPSIGAMWRLTLDLKKIAPKFSSNAALLKFLQLRFNSRQFQLDLFQKFFSEKTVTLAQSATLFDISNDAYRRFLEADRGLTVQQTSSNDLPGFTPFTFHSNSVLHQSDMRTIFEDMLDQPVVSPDRSRFVVAVMIEFIKSLEKMRFQVDYKVEDVLVSHLVRTAQFYQLHQFLQYHVITDRTLMACKLLTLNKDYPPAIQLALDMLKRLGVNSHAEILELLLSREEVVTAINFAKKFNLVDDLKRPDKFLEVAKSTGDRIMFYSAYKFFEDFNMQQFHQRKLLPSQKCEKYTEHFKLLFGENSLNDHTVINSAVIAQELSVF